MTWTCPFEQGERRPVEIDRAGILPKDADLGRNDSAIDLASQGRVLGDVRDPQSIGFLAL